MAILTAYSGLDGKLPAAFLLEIAGRRILLDLGEGPTPGQRPDLAGLDQVDAIVLSHGHIDHVGALDLWRSLGAPPVYATAATFAALAPMGLSLPATAQRLLPLRGPARILDLEVTLGRSGHAIGGVWLHFAQDGGWLYMGDWSRESTVLAFDMPPAAAVMITDISYGDRDVSLTAQIDALAAQLAPGTVLPVPPQGRGSELALRLHQAGREVAVCPVVRAEIASLSAAQPSPLHAGLDILLADLAMRLDCASMASATALIVAVEAEHAASLVPQLAQTDRRFAYTGHVAPGSEAAQMVAAGRADAAHWSVHPRLTCTLWLAEAIQAQQVLPVFGAFALAPKTLQGLGSRLCTTRELTFPKMADTRLSQARPAVALVQE